MPFKCQVHGLVNVVKVFSSFNSRVFHTVVGLTVSSNAFPVVKLYFLSKN